MKQIESLSIRLIGKKLLEYVPKPLNHAEWLLLMIYLQLTIDERGRSRVMPTAEEESARLLAQTAIFLIQ
ncbi:hypothetical protein [Spirosoma aerophilum]